VAPPTAATLLTRLLRHEPQEEFQQRLRVRKLYIKEKMRHGKGKAAHRDVLSIYRPFSVVRGRGGGVL
jgi:hypothetical protein